ncbi:hypothetical protein ACFYXW_12220 [Streptomyces sp. NPDC001981]|uniref:hypothetical protein n=1 Tax=Streptomyces sp. NPDC001981 TaxID=3364628 RepID=UPI0036A3363E
MTGPHIGMRATVWAATVVLGLTSGGVLGAGTARADDPIDTLSAQQIADRSSDALRGARSMHLSTRTASADGSAPTTLDLIVDRAGNCTGSVGLGGKQGSVRIVKRGDTVWVRPDAQFWKNRDPRVGSALASILAGRYMKGSASDPRLSSLSGACDLATFQKVVSENAKSDKGTLTKGEKTTLAGAPVVPLVRTWHGQKVTMYVAATGKPYPLRIDVTGGSPKADATVGFSAFDKPVPTTTPPPDETVGINVQETRAT